MRVVVRAGGPSERQAREDGFVPYAIDDGEGGRGGAPGGGLSVALGDCQVVAVLTPDEVTGAILRDVVEPHVGDGTLLVFAHGFALRQADGTLPVREGIDLALVGPLGPGKLLRERFENGEGLAGLLAIVRDDSGRGRDRALAYAAMLRMTRPGVLETSLDEEVVSDLFAEQVVLVGGVVELMRAAWETLVDGGVSEEIAYYSCVQELKQILDLVHAEGLAGMRARISGTAQYGGLTRGPAVIGDASRAAMRQALEQIQSGEFADEWQREAEAGGPKLRELRDGEAGHRIESAGERVRRELG